MATIGNIFYFNFASVIVLVTTFQIGHCINQPQDYIFNHIDKGQIRSHLYKLTEEIGWKVAGTQGEYDAAAYIHDHFKQVGLSNVKLVPYQVLLSYPDANHLNSFQILDTKDNVIFTANQFEDNNLIKNHSTYQDVYLRSNYIAYSPPTKLKAPILYVNYARNEDFEKLKSKLNRTVICLARYGKISRMLKAEIAQTHGCSGLVFYSHDEDHNIKGNHVFYPHSEFLPKTGVQRGTLKNQHMGDYLTPSYPSTPEAYRLQQHHSQLPSIPVHVIRNDDLTAILELLFLKCQSKDEYSNSGDDLTAFLNISMQNLIKETNNVIALIPGKMEPDRYVIIGNHYDSWGPGSIDPSIGTAILMELARVFMALRNHTDWQPYRSILFCAWGAEEYGSIGAREFVEEFSQIISSRAVAYINTDVAVLGNYSIKFKSQPLLKNIIFNTTKTISEPNDRLKSSLFETYRKKFPDKKKDGKVPMVGEANTGSDYVHFIGLAGVPSLDVRYTYDESLGLNFYPLYHTGYENFHLFDRFIDPGFKYSHVVAKVMADLLLKLSSEAVLPYSVDHYVEHVQDCITEVTTKMNGIEGLCTSITKLQQKVQKLLIARVLFKKEVEQMDLQNKMTVRILNDRLMLLQKSFMYEDTLEGRETNRNALHVPSKNGKQVCLAEIQTILTEFNSSSNNKIVAKQEILKEISRIHFFLDTAISILDSNDFH